ncbi:uncharacterized protein K452DRAFT_225410 [Aplosporella prunicola CBS 121167]|uniref:PNPLA domain-containing protein n=1 Tax=Aplosporella prunicola CBS 121167 TaxID=1176127 RepID=A0A6A6BG53_9PEZI|nr:uncharacterized protein K452DRAFT_225410 [Aplosporella prunicola CBS 121167]KAF2143150.1 hypothetical protein K452DRAFT_225410 [Aplosporella prunicola CBS 121167]
MGGDPKLLEKEGLCLLSLDGGGVRGLSSLYTLRSLMKRLNKERGAPVKPCDLFDLIGGTSTGGLIAIMLGRLEMEVDECIQSYVDLMGKVFHKGRVWNPFSITLAGNRRARFDSRKLEEAIRAVILKQNINPDEPFNDGKVRGCRVFVCTTSKRYTNTATTILRSYDPPEDVLTFYPTIIEAALATSAAPTFFDDVQIGERGFVDGGLQLNNPVAKVEEEASDIWCPKNGELKPLVKCFVSIGTGYPKEVTVQDRTLRFLAVTAVSLASETEITAKEFIKRWRGHYDENRYFRFNVQHGLDKIGLEEYQKRGAVEEAAENYLSQQELRGSLRRCVANLKEKESVWIDNCDYA